MMQKLAITLAFIVLAVLLVAAPSVQAGKMKDMPDEMFLMKHGIDPMDPEAMKMLKDLMEEQEEMEREAKEAAKEAAEEAKEAAEEEKEAAEDLEDEMKDMMEDMEDDKKKK